MRIRDDCLIMFVTYMRRLTNIGQILHLISIDTHQSYLDTNENVRVTWVIWLMSRCSVSIDLVFLTKRGIPPGKERCMRYLGTSLL